MMKRLWFALGLIVAAGVFAFGQDAKVDYYAVLADGKKIGHNVHTRKVEGGLVLTRDEMNLAISRAGAALAISIASTHTETPDAKPVAFEYTQAISILTQKVRGVVTADGKLEVTTEVMGTSQKQTVDWPQGALMAEGLRLLEEKQPLTEGHTYSATVFEPTMLTAIQAKATVGAVVELDLLGRVVKATEVKTIMEVPGGGQIPTISYVDAEHNALKTIMSVMDMKLEIIACDKEFAMSPNDVLDFLDKMLVPSPAPLGDVKGKTVVYTLAPKPDAKVQIPATDNQTVQVQPDGRIVVTVKPVVPAAGAAFPYKGQDAKVLEAMKPAQYLQSDRKEVRDLAVQAAGSATDLAEAVKSIESFVHGYIQQKDMSVGYATAAEVVVSKQGDCTEHAILAAAMCRSIGIPARVVFGVVYVPEFGQRKDVFGGHAWAEAFVGDKWVGLDATRAPRGYDGNHITLAVGNGDPKDFFSLVSTLGYFTIEKIAIQD